MVVPEHGEHRRLHRENLNQYSAVGSVTPTYDGNGNLTYDGTFTYGYDAESRLVSVSQGGTTVASYAYDAQGRRKSKTVGSTTTTFATDADNREVLEYDGTTGAVQRWYAFGQGANAVLNQMNAALGTRETMIPDIQGSIIGTLDFERHPRQERLPALWREPRGHHRHLPLHSPPLRPRDRRQHQSAFRPLLLPRPHLFPDHRPLPAARPDRLRRGQQPLRLCQK